MARTARQAIRSWYTTHPKTFCPVVGEVICPAKGCENPLLRADRRCNIDLKMAEAAKHLTTDDDVHGWIYDLRESPEGLRWILNFGYDRNLLADLKSAIPASGRRFDPETREWLIDKEYNPILRSLFANFDDFVTARYQWLKGRGKG